MKNVNDKELVAVTTLPAPERYGYFMRHVADWGEIWALRSNEGFILVANEDEKELIPIWPHRRFAEEWASANQKDTEPVAIALDYWLEKWTPGLKKDERGIAVFPVPDGPGIMVSPDRLHEDLEDECSQYE